jgi:hypothetical protein
VHEVPLLERALLTFHDQKALAVQHEEVLLCVLRVVHAVWLPWSEDLDVDPELLEPSFLLVLERRRRSEGGVTPPARLACVDDEPAVSLRDETSLPGDQPCFLGHAHLRVETVVRRLEEKRE